MVLVEWRGNFLLHLVKEVDSDRLLIGNAGANKAITLNVSVSPSSLTFTNSGAGNDYSISGSGSIADSGLGTGTTLTKTVILNGLIGLNTNSINLSIINGARVILRPAPVRLAYDLAAGSAGGRRLLASGRDRLRGTRGRP